MPGGFDDAASLARAASAVDAILAVTTPFEGVDVEVRHGKAIADAASAASVGHLVYSSVANADHRTGIPHFDSKLEVEEYIKTLDVPWTVVAPVYFFENVLFPWNVGDMREGRFRQALAADRPLAQISTRDIGAFNALVIEERDRFIGQRIDIAADELSGPQMAAALSRASGRSIEYVEQSLDEVRAQFPDMAVMMEWLGRSGFAVDIEALRRDYPGVAWTSFDDWVLAQNWSTTLA